MVYCDVKLIVRYIFFVIVISLISVDYEFSSYIWMIEVFIGYDWYVNECYIGVIIMIFVFIILIESFMRNCLVFGYFIIGLFYIVI